MSPIRLENRIKRNRVAMKGKNRRPYSPIVSRMMPRMNPTSSSARLCSWEGTSFRPAAAKRRSPATAAMTTHIISTALFREISIPNKDRCTKLCSSNGWRGLSTIRPLRMTCRWTRLRLGPPLGRSVGVQHAGNRAENQAYHQAPRSRRKEVGIRQPAQGSTDDEGGKQFGSKTNRLSQPRIKRIARGHEIKGPATDWAERGAIQTKST